MIEPAVSLAPPRQARSKIAVRGIWMTFPHKGGQDEAIHVLEDINIEVRDGEFVCLVGPSGCGKSTLLNIAGGFLAGVDDQVADTRFSENTTDIGPYPWEAP